MVRDRTRKLEEEVADLKARWPAHSVKPSMWQRLEETEEELEKGRGEASDGVESTSTASVASWPWKGLQVSLRSARNMALVDFARCQPERCEGRICLASRACRSHLLRQEHPGEVPMADPALCRACGDCLRACPLDAIRMATV